MATILPPRERFGPNICRDLTEANQREWLVTNGLGSYACGTISGILTRRYHGLLVANLTPKLSLLPRHCVDLATGSLCFGGISGS